jgi:tetratricopeptide (TPR) repeat protein
MELNRHVLRGIVNTPKIPNDEQSTSKSFPQPAAGILASSLNFNTKFIWKEVESSIHKVVSYLKDNKIGQELNEVVYQSHNHGHESSDNEKLNMIILILDKALKENKSEELNTFFIEFYRLSALFLFCIDERNRAIEIVDKFINKINHSFKNKEEMEIDINLLIERDKLLLNKAQMLFWEECYEESLQIIYSKIAYFQKETTDEIYCLKMMNFIISVLNYQGWIYAMKQEPEEAEKSFLLANQMIKDAKKLLQDNIQEPDFRELFKRKVKTFHQYLSFINMNIIKDKIDKRDRLIMHYLETSHRLVLEIIKVMTKDTFEFDEDIHKSHLILYYMQAALLSLSVSYSIIDGTNVDSNSEEKIDLERTLMFLSNAIVDNTSLDMNCKIKFRHILNNCVFKIIKVILSHGKIVNKFEISSHQSIEFVENKMKELISNFDESGSTIIKDTNITQSIQNTEFYINSKLIKNFALFNINRFSYENMTQTVGFEINEIFVTEYICNKNFICSCENHA